MTFKVLDISVCPGGGHITVLIQRLPAGRVWNLHVHKKEILSTETNREHDLEQKAIDRLISAARESGETTSVGIRNALLNKEFDI